nr:unnamed protein product [Spirometra erinaceieuropaei]
MSHDQATARSAEMPASVDVRELCQALMSVLETKQSSTDTLPLLKPGDNFDVWYSQANVHLASIAAKDRARYICRHLSTEVLTKASVFGAAFPDQPANLTDIVLAAHFRAGLLDDNLCRKLIKKPNLASEALLTLVKEYEERYDPSVAAPCYSTSAARKRQTRSVATQTFRNFTRPFRGRQARVAQISSESYTVPAVTSTSDFPALIVNATVVDRRVAFLVDTGAACSLLNPQGFTRTWLQQTEISHRKPRIVASKGMPLSCSLLVDVPFRLGSSEISHPFYVCPDIQWQGILGTDFPYAHRFCVDFAAGQLTSKSTTIPFYFPHAPDPQLFCDPVGLHPPQPSDLVHLVPDSPGFSSEQITAVRNLIFKNSAAFAWDGEPLRRTNVLQNTIDTGSARPIRQPPRRVPVHFQKQLEQTIKDMLDRHVIRPSSSPWASPIVLVKKKDGYLRLCVDYRKLNAVTVKDSFPLPRIDTTLEALAGAACFSTLDLQSGCWQVEMAPEDRPKTAFSIPSGLYEIETMPFGLANAPATFQRLMASVLRNLCPTACLVYLDDVIVHGSTVESHLDNLQTVFNRLQTVGLKLNPAKCCFLKKSVPFLGHIVSTEGVKSDPTKTEQIRSWPQPTSVSELRGFLGLASYYRRFIKDFAHIVAPLNRLTIKQNAFDWSDECERSFEELKRRLISPPLLAFPNISESAPPFILDTDASDTLAKPERNYSTTRKELLAVVTFAKKFHHYLAGKRFILRTDHQTLRWLENFKDLTGQLAGWQADLLEYSYTVIQRAGKKNQHADALSRRAQAPPPVATYVPATAITFGTPDHSGASDDPEGPTFAAHFNKLKPYALDDSSCVPVSSELPSFPSAELPHPPTDPSSIVSVPSSPPAPAVPTSPALPSPLPPLVSRTVEVPREETEEPIPGEVSEEDA